jgi:segregation and condensation protein B
MSKDNFEEVKTKVEAILFSYGDWISANEIMLALGLDTELLINNSLKDLYDKYEKDYPYTVEDNEDGKWRMALKKDYEDVVSDLISNIEIPKPVLKVLSVIAYEQPVSKTRLFEILGRSVKQEVDFLYKAKFVYYEKKGIGKYYKVTKKFYDYFKIDESEDFREKANKNITHFLGEEPKPESEN